MSGTGNAFSFAASTASSVQQQMSNTMQVTTFFSCQHSVTSSVAYTTSTAPVQIAEGPCNNPVCQAAPPSTLPIASEQEIKSVNQMKSQLELAGMSGERCLRMFSLGEPQTQADLADARCSPEVITALLQCDASTRSSATASFLGHRNILGLEFDEAGRLWDLEHGPAGGDELNLVKQGANYGWPVVSDGNHYDGKKIPRHATRRDFAAPAISWNPVIAPGDFIFYSGKLWPQWRGQALIAAMARSGPGLVRVSLNGGAGTEQARYPTEKRLRDIVEAPDGSLYAIEDGAGGRLLHLTPAG